MPEGTVASFGIIASLNFFDFGLKLPSLLPFNSTNQMFPSLSIAISDGFENSMGMSYSTILPVAGSSIPSLLPFDSVNQTAPSALTAIPDGWLLAVGILYSAIAPSPLFNLPILLLFCSVNQMLSEASAAISTGLLDGVGITYSVIGPSAENTTLVKNTILTIPINQSFHFFIRSEPISSY